MQNVLHWQPIDQALQSMLRLMKLVSSQLVVGFVVILLGSSTTAAAALVVLGHDGCTDALNLLVLFLDLLGICFRIRVHPRLAVFDGIHDLLLLLRVELLAKALVVTRALGR